MLAGILKDLRLGGCWRGFLDFLYHGILGRDETGESADGAKSMSRDELP